MYYVLVTNEENVKVLLEQVYKIMHYMLVNNEENVNHFSAVQDMYS